MIWQGSLATIPAGWVFCDGTNGTPDLRDQFVPGATGAFPPGTTGGTTAHDHEFTGDGHNHALTQTTPLVDGAAESHFRTSSTPIAGTTDPDPNLPPYYNLAYIMYLGT